MLIQGSPDILSPPRNPLGVSGLSLAGGLGYVDTTPRPEYGGTSLRDQFRGDLFFGNLANQNDPGGIANIFGSYYDPAIWGAGGVAGHQRDLLGHWKRVLSAYPGATWNDIALAYGTPLSTIESFARAANASAFPVIRAVWQNPMIPDSIKRTALGLIVRRYGLTPWEWASVVGLDEATAQEVVNVPVPEVARTSFMFVIPAVQATATQPGFVLNTFTGEVVVIPAGSDPFIDAGISNDAAGRRQAVLTYPGIPPNQVELVFIPVNAPPMDRPIIPGAINKLRDLLAQVQKIEGERQRNITTDEPQPAIPYDVQAATLIQQLGLTETEVANLMGLSLQEFRQFYVFEAGRFGIKEEEQTVMIPSELPELVMPSESALQPIEPVFFFDLPTGFNTGPASEKAALYLSKIDEGFTDAQIRITVESALGPQDDSGWTALRNLAAAQRAAEIAARAAADAAAAAAAAQDQANAVVAADPQSSAAVTTAQAADQAATAAAVADNAATIAVESVNTAAAAADAGDSAGSVQASTAAINASTTATDAAAAAAAGGVSETPANAATVANVTQAYRDILKRMPDAAGLEFYTTGGFTIDQVIADMKASPEFKAISTVITPAAGGAFAPLLLAVAAAVILGG